MDLDCFSSDTLISAPFWDREDRAPFWCSMPSRFMRKNSVQIGELVIKDFQWFAGIPVDCFMTRRYGNRLSGLIWLLITFIKGVTRMV